jgi:hypothetical protein
MATLVTDFSTPQAAIQSLESAYVHKNIEAAVAAKDFDEEARLMLQNINPQLAADPEVLKKTAQVLELSFREQIKDKGFPDFANIKCSLSNPESISPTLAKVTETCVFSDGGTSVQALHAFKGAQGWRVIIVPS